MEPPQVDNKIETLELVGPQIGYSLD